MDSLNLTTKNKSNKRVKSTGDLCMDCNSEYCIVKKLQAYMNEQTARSLRRFECTLCRKTYTSLSSLRKHQKTHVENKLFRCEFCAKSFTVEYTFKKHRMLHTNGREFKCTVCVKRFAHQSSLSVHNRLHENPGREFSCNFCGKHFKWKSNLNAHLILHEMQPFVCELCHMIFESAYLLQEHQQKHAHPDTQCRYCKKVFANRYKVNYHIRLKHQNLAPWQCQYCTESFSTATKFRSHIYEFHDTPKPYPCEKCNRTFLTKHNLVTHIEKHQNANEHYECDNCGNQFQYKRNLYTHMMRHVQNNDMNIEANKKRPTKNTVARIITAETDTFNCTNNTKYLQNETNNEGNDNGDQRLDDCMKVKISFVTENQINQAIPLYELNIPIVDLTKTERNFKPTIVNENSHDEPVVLVQAFTTPLSSSTNDSINRNIAANKLNRRSNLAESFRDSFVPQTIVITDSSSDEEK